MSLNKKNNDFSTYLTLFVSGVKAKKKQGELFAHPALLLVLI